MTNNFTNYDPMSRYPAEDRARIRDFFLRGNDIAVAVEDHNIRLDALAVESGMAADTIYSVMHGHILDIGDGPKVSDGEAP